MRKSFYRVTHACGHPGQYSCACGLSPEVMSWLRAEKCNACERLPRPWAKPQQPRQHVPWVAFEPVPAGPAHVASRTV